VVFFLFYSDGNKHTPLSHPRTLILNFTMTHTRCGRTICTLLDNLLTQGVKILLLSPESDGDLQTVVRGKVLYYRQIYLNRPDPIVFMHVTVDTSG